MDFPDLGSRSHPFWKTHRARRCAVPSGEIRSVVALSFRRGVHGRFEQNCLFLALREHFAAHRDTSRLGVAHPLREMIPGRVSRASNEQDRRRRMSFLIFMRCYVAFVYLLFSVGCSKGSELPAISFPLRSRPRWARAEPADSTPAKRRASRSLLTFAKRWTTCSRITPGYYAGRNKGANFMFEALSMTPVSGSK